MSVAREQDVKRLLGSSDDPDNTVMVRRAIAAADEWVRGYTGLSLDDAAAPHTAVFENVRDDSWVELPELAPAIHEVRLYLAADSDGFQAVQNVSYQVQRGNRIRLLGRHSTQSFIAGVAQAGSLPKGSSLALWYARVEVDYTSSNQVPESLRQAAAIIAASVIQRGTLEVTGVTSEHLGDYGYTLGGGTTSVALDSIPPMARELCKRFKRSRVSVV